MLPRLFHAFEQGEQTRTRRFGGLGLGLSIANAIVGLHGGSLTAYSEGRNKGAVFTVELETIASASGAAAEVVTAVPQKGEQWKILLVEDHADTLHILSKLLTKWGYAVTSADCVQSALNAAVKERFDLLLSDLGLPDGNGCDLMRRLQELYGIRGIAVSGFGTEEDIRQSRSAGFDEHLVKPLNFEMLQASIRRLAGQNA